MFWPTKDQARTISKVTKGSWYHVSVNRWVARKKKGKPSMIEWPSRKDSGWFYCTPLTTRKNGDQYWKNNSKRKELSNDLPSNWRANRRTSLAACNQAKQAEEDDLLEVKERTSRKSTRPTSPAYRENKNQEEHPIVTIRSTFNDRQKKKPNRRGTRRGKPSIVDKVINNRQNWNAIDNVEDSLSIASLRPSKKTT